MSRLMAAARGWSERICVLGCSRPPQAPHGFDFSLNVMHVEEDGVCPRCLSWIGPDDIVRRTALGPAQHEACPVTALPAVRR